LRGDIAIMEEDIDKEFLIRIYLYVAEYLLRLPRDDEIALGLKRLHENGGKASALNFMRYSDEVSQLDRRGHNERYHSLIISPKLEEILGPIYVRYLNNRLKERYDTKKYESIKDIALYRWLVESFIENNRPIHMEMLCRLAHKLYEEAFTKEEVQKTIADDFRYYNFFILYLHCRNVNINDVNEYFHHIQSGDLDIVDICYHYIQRCEYLSVLTPKGRVNEIAYYINKYKDDKEIQQFVAQYIQKNQKGIRYICYPGSSGYAQSAKQYILALVKAGVPVMVEFEKAFFEQKDSKVSFEDKVLFYLASQNIEYDCVVEHILMTTMMYYFNERERTKNKSIEMCALTMWEYEHVPKYQIEILNTFDHVIFPSKWNVEIFKKNKLNVGATEIYQVIDNSAKIKKYDCPDKNIDEKKLYFDDIPSDHYVFLMVGMWNPRKGMHETIEAFLKAHNSSSRCTLYVKTAPFEASEDDITILREANKLINEYKDVPNIIINTDLLNDREMDYLYDNSHCYVQLTKGEGIGLGVCEMARRGKPVIVTDYSAHKEYLHHAYYVPCAIAPITADKRYTPEVWDCFLKEQHKKCLWAIPDIEKATEIIRYVYEHQKEVAEMSKDNADYIQKKCSYEKIGSDFLKLFEMLKPEQENVISLVP
jgi:glycosyltransferase involved in cell wall biosynthesis